MKENAVFEVSIPSTRNNNGHIEYQINIITNSKILDKCYTCIYKRYSDFLTLHNKIKSDIPALPDFPKKKWFFNSSRNVIESRRQCFEVYLRYITQFIIRNNFESQTFGLEIIKFIQSANK